MRSDLLTCPFLTSERECKLVADLVSTPCPVTEETCLACSKTDRPHRINLVTLTLAHRRNPSISERELTLDISQLGKGFGTQLANLFKHLSLSAVKGCECPGHQDILDLWTPAYIEQNIDRVVDWLAEESRKRKIPFLRFVVKRILLSLLHTHAVSQAEESIQDNSSNVYKPRIEGSFLE